MIPELTESEAAKIIKKGRHNHLSHRGNLWVRM